jgi:hypothetical protein
LSTAATDEKTTMRNAPCMKRDICRTSSGRKPFPMASAIHGLAAMPSNVAAPAASAAPRTAAPAKRHASASPCRTSRLLKIERNTGGK